MTLDQLIEHLTDVRERHGGGLAVMVGQRNPSDPAFWSGVNVEPSNINEVVSSDQLLSALKQVPTKSGWVWFEFPTEGIEHRKLKPRGPSPE